MGYPDLAPDDLGRLHVDGDAAKVTAKPTGGRRTRDVDALTRLVSRGGFGV
jgi:hypothetical protein